MKSSRVNLNKLIVYGLLPLVVPAGLVLLYFSGLPWAQELVAPARNRELGLLEHLDLALLLAMLAMALLGLRRKKLRFERIGLIVLAGLLLFFTLEETDYGLNYLAPQDLTPGRPATVSSSLGSGVRNVHNLGGIDKMMASATDAGLIICFLILPLALARSSRPLIRYLLPDRWSIVTLASMFLVVRLAQTLESAGFSSNLSLHKNLSEFQELVVYYLLAVYLFEVVFRRDYRTGPQAQP